MRKIDWNFVLNWSVGFTIFWFGISCMTARDFAAKDYFLAALDGRQVDWNSVQHAITVKIVGGFITSLMLFFLIFFFLILWSYFVRKTPSYSESQLREKTKHFLTVLLGATIAVGLMFFYYAVVDNKSYMLAVEGIVVIALAYFIKSKKNLFACYVLLAIFIYLLVKYTVSVEGTRLMIVFLYTVATCTWSISCLLWKTQPLFGTQQSVKTFDSNTNAATNRAMEDKFYKIAFDEITINRVEPTLWAKAFAHAEGNEDKAKALYVKYRAEQLNTLKTPSSQVTADDIDITDQPKSNIWVEPYTNNKRIITVATIIGLVGVGLLVSQLQKISTSSSVTLQHTPTQAPPPVAQPQPQKPLIGGRYRDHGDGTVTDVQTGRQWMRCSLGQTWQGSTCVGEANKYGWQAALDAARALNRQGGYGGGYRDWRVPTKEDLLTLVYCSSGQPKTWNDTGKPCEGDYERPTLYQPAFPDTPPSYYWSSSVSAGYPGGAWVVGFYLGDVYAYYKAPGFHVRLARGGQ